MDEPRFALRLILHDERHAESRLIRRFVSSSDAEEAFTLLAGRALLSFGIPPREPAWSRFLTATTPPTRPTFRDTMITKTEGA